MKAGAGIGATVNLGNYESLRFDFKVEADRLLTEKEERMVKKRMRQLRTLVDELMAETISEVEETIELDDKSAFKFSAKSERK
jgi:hypothetical protein